MTRKAIPALLLLAALAAEVAPAATAAPADANAGRSEVICIQPTVLTIQPPEICLPDPLPVA
jgi:hypothetical protein